MNMTPRQFAHSVAIDWLRQAYIGNTADVDDLKPAERREVLRQIAKLHDSLLKKSGLDGLPLSMDK